jgi:hypothetical protein
MISAADKAIWDELDDMSKQHVEPSNPLEDTFDGVCRQ